MAIDIYRKRMIEAYREIRRPNMFLSRLFRVSPRNIFDGEKVEIDIQRNGEPIAIDVQRGTGGNKNSSDKWTTKEYVPPTYDECMPFDVQSLQKRVFGMNPYDSTNVSYQSALITRILEGWLILEDKIKRSIEKQASDILQTGILTFQNNESIDFKVKATHLITAGTAWNAVGATILADLEAAMDVVRADGRVDIGMMIGGSGAINAMLDDSAIQARLDNRRINVGEINPRMTDSGGKFHGRLSVGEYVIDIWSYNDRYDHPSTGINTKFVDSANVILLPENPRFDMAFAGVPQVINSSAEFANILPARVAIPAAGDFHPYAFTDERGRNTEIGISSRPLAMPTAVDSFARIDTGV